MKHLIRLTLGLGLVLAAAGCAGDDDGQAQEDAAVLQIRGTWSEPTLDSAPVRTSVFECPFKMPPDEYDDAGTFANGRVEAELEVEPGTWCVLSFIDVDTTDGGLKYVEGLDAVAYPPEGEKGHRVELTAGQTTALDLDYEVRQPSE